VFYGAALFRIEHGEIGRSHWIDRITRMHQHIYDCLYNDVAPSINPTLYLRSIGRVSVTGLRIFG
jgi:hypothetical protein